MPLHGPGPLTLFVPTNKAVDRSRDGSIIYMLKEVSIQFKYIQICLISSQFIIFIAQANVFISKAKHKLQELLRHHMFSQAAVRPCIINFPNNKVVTVTPSQ